MTTSIAFRHCCVLALLAAAGCRRSDAPAPARTAESPSQSPSASAATPVTSATTSDPAQTIAATTSCPRRDTTTFIDKWSVTFTNTTIAQLDSLDQRIAAATTAQLPALLYARGRARAAFVAVPGSPAGAYAKAHRDAFFYNDPDAEWITRGRDFDTLIARFPKSEFADEAAWAVARLPGGGECEGSVPCYVGRAWDPMARFLTARPNSPRADIAVTLAVRAFDELDGVEDLRVERDGNEIRGVEPLVAQFDSIGRTLLPPRSTRMLLRAGEVWERYLNYNRARSAYRVAAAGADAGYRACIEEHLAAIPSRWFTQDTAHVVTDHRVELRWQSPGAGVSGFTISRWTSRWEPVTVFAHIDSATRSWLDTSAVAGRLNWYRVDADMPDGRLSSNPVVARTPPTDARFTAAAVSTTDKRLHLFGALSNRFPHVMIISQDGASIEQRDGILAGIEAWNGGGNVADDYPPDVWLADANGRGVLHFTRQGRGFPPELLSVFRHGREQMHTDTVRRPRAVVAVDEPSRAAWAVSSAKLDLLPGLLHAGSMDCIAETSECWITHPNEAVLLGSGGEPKLTVPFPGAKDTGAYAGGALVFANPRDASAWIYGPPMGRLLHIDKSGKIQLEMLLADPAHARGISVAMDRDAQMLWYMRVAADQSSCKVSYECSMELVQLDTRAARPTPKVVASHLPDFGDLLCDLSGGVWWVTMYKVQRIDASGRVVVTIPLKVSF